MKKVLILYIILFIGTVYSQVMPKEYKLNIFKFSNAQLNQLDNINIQHTAKFSVEPEQSTVIISNFISDIIVAGDTIWFGTGKGIARTTNTGITFQNYFDMQPFGDDDVSGLAVYGNYVVVATAESRDVGGETHPAGTGIKVSSDRGLTWNAYPQPKDPRDGTERFDSLKYGNNWIKSLRVLVDIDNLSYDVLVTRKNLTSDSLVIWITSWAGELRKSLDYGANFTRVILPPDNLDSIYPGGNYLDSTTRFVYDPTVHDNHKCFSIIAENDSTIYVGTAGGINKSTDWGLSWRKYRASTAGLSGNFVVGLNIQKFGGKSIVWGATNAGGGSETQFNGFSYTSNSGATWGTALKDDAVFSHNMGFKDSIVYAATDNGIWRSFFNNGNFSWSKPSVIYDSTIRDQVRTNFFYAVDSQNDSIWVGSGDGLARTRDLGNPWTEKWKIFRAYRPISSTQETYAAPNPFSPDDEVTRIYYKTGKTNANVTIRIFDFSMQPVRVVLQNALRTTPDVTWTAWDGKRDDGMQVANGVYFYRIEVDQDMTFWGKILVLQ